MLEKPFRVLQLNLSKRNTVQWGLLNDSSADAYDFLLLTEPHVFFSPQTRQPEITAHQNWEAFKPSQTRQANHVRFSYRSAILVNKRIHAKALKVPSPDITAVETRVNQRPTLLVSVYVPVSRDTIDSEQSLRETIDILQRTISQFQQAYPLETCEIIIAGDFNRHDQLWGGDRVGEQSWQGEGEPIISFMQQNHLQLLLPRGTPTFERQDGSGTSTIDLIMTTEEMAGQMIQCNTDTSDYGSDHRAIQTEFHMQIIDNSPTRPRRLFKEADWENINRRLKESLTIPQACQTIEHLEQAVRHLTETVTTTIQETVPLAKPSPYAKRWWTSELTQLRKQLHKARNVYTAAKRRNQIQAWMVPAIRRTQHDYFHKMQKQKRQHWKAFLADPSNVWKAGALNKPNHLTNKIPTLQTLTHTADTNEEKAQLLMSQFFPPQPLPNPTNHRHRNTKEAQLKDNPLQYQEVRKAIFDSAPDKAAGVDDLPFRVWQEIWPTVDQHVFLIYEASIQLGHVPQDWKTANIIPLRKAGKDNYTLPESYRPISLLSTLSKGLEAVIAKRLSYLAEKHHLLPRNQFGARPRRSCEQALNILVEKICAAWRIGRVLTLITFDVEGAFNGVNADILIPRLRERRVPEKLVAWIQSFCKDRKGLISFSSFQSISQTITQAGLPQGSPLSPSLYNFYNADLVESPIDKSGGSIGFIDDYTRWVTGETPEQNRALIQQTVVPRVEKWAKDSGVRFQINKTKLIHFTRNRTKMENAKEPISFQGVDIVPEETVKMLGVTLDSELRMKQHISKVASKATTQCLAIKRLKGLSPRSMKQLYISTVTSITDYAASTWYRPKLKSTSRIKKTLDAIQRLGAQAITGAFKTVSLSILEVEADLPPTDFRLRKKVLSHWTNMHTLPDNHPFWICRNGLERQGRKFPSPFSAFRQEYYDIGQNLETIIPQPRAPYYPELDIRIEKNREKAKEDASNLQKPWTYFTDGSARNQLIGAAVVTLNSPGQVRVKRIQTLNHQWNSNPYAAELHAIDLALQTMNDPPIKTSWIAIPRIIATDSQGALKSLAKPRQQSGQFIIRSIFRKVKTLKDKGFQLQFHWVPAHEGIMGNELAHQAALEATTKGRIVDEANGQMPKRLRSAALREEGQRIQHERIQQFQQDSYGRFTREMDQALPQRHTSKLYNKLSASEASILVQLRSGHAGLNHHLHRIKQTDSAQCVCGYPKESVRHFLIDCPLWTEQRKILNKVAKEHFSNLSYLLGGWQPQNDRQGKRINGRKEDWSPNTEVIKATIDFVQNTARFSG